MSVQYLGKQQLKNFEYYKYSSIDTSPLSNYVMHPFWNQVVKLVPKSIAPNVLTFSGFMLTTINTLLMTYYDYSFCASSDHCKNPDGTKQGLPIPNWVWLVCAVNHFLAHTLDGIDGKQARRTNSSGPLGELFDHGLDSWACLLMPACLYSVFGRGPDSCDPFRVFLCLWVVHFCFYLSHWEKYITGVLYLPWSYDISQFILLIAFLISYFGTYTIWKFTVPFFGWTLSTGDVTEIIIYVGSFGLTIPVAIFNIVRAIRKGQLKQNTWKGALRPGLGFTVFFVMAYFWAAHSPNDVIRKDPRFFYYMVGTVFSNISCRLIISQMTLSECEALSWMIYPIGVVMAIVFGVPNLDLQQELNLLKALTFFVVLAHIHYGVCVVRQLCSLFNINCFTLKKPSVN